MLGAASCVLPQKPMKIILVPYYIAAVNQM